MDKNKLVNFIEKYSLGGEVDSVMIESTEDELTVGIISSTKSLIGKVTVKDNQFPVGKYGIYTTSQLKGMLGVLNDDIKVDVAKEKGRDTSLIFSDTGTTVQYMLAEEKVIPQVPDLKRLPAFNISIVIDEEFINTFGKSKRALSDVDRFTFTSDGDESKIVIGHSTNNSNRISMDVKSDTEGAVGAISFNSNYLKAILDANKDFETSKMEISTDGLCRMEFTQGDYQCEYYLVESKE